MAEGEEALRDFRALYRAHYGFVWHALYRFGIDWATLEDACQDVFVVAYRRRNDFRGSSPRAWLYGIARRVASNDRRSRNRRQRREAAVMEQPSRDGAREAIMALDYYLTRLRPEERELFILSELEGMTGPEIAEARKRNLATVYTQIRKLRQDLRADLEDLPLIRKARPRATTHAWASLVPLLRAPPVGLMAFGAKLSWSGLWVAGGASIVTAALIVVSSLREPNDGTAPPRVPDVSVVSGPATPSRSGEIHLSPPVVPMDNALEAHPPTRTVDGERKGAQRKVQPRGRVSEDEADTRPIAPPTVLDPPRPNLAEENELLRRAADRLRANDPAGALELTGEHDQRFPGSMLADLRTALRIEALCALGQHHAARSEAHAFLRGRPGSPFAERIERGCRSPQ